MAMVALVRITPPASPVVSGEEAAARLGLDVAFAPQLAPLLLAAEQTFDGPQGMLGRALVSQQWDMYFTLSAYPSRVIPLPLPPLVSVDELAIENGSGELEAVEPSLYRVTPGTQDVLLSSSLSVSRDTSMRLRFTCGYGAVGTDVPEPIRQAIVMKAAFLRSMSRDDPQLRSETVDGVGTSTWAVSDVVGTAYEKAAMALVQGYRVPVI